MKMSTLVGGVLLWSSMSIASNLYAQQPPKPSPELEAVGAKLMQEINAGIQCNANAIAGRTELERLQAEVKQLKQELADAQQKSGSGTPHGSSGPQPEVR